MKTLAFLAFDNPMDTDFCAYCGSASDSQVLDHSHLTGLCRGYVCRRCNNPAYVDSDERWVSGTNPFAVSQTIRVYADAYRCPVVTGGPDHPNYQLALHLLGNPDSGVGPLLFWAEGWPHKISPDVGTMSEYLDLVLEHHERTDRQMRFYVDQLATAQKAALV